MDRYVGKCIDLGNAAYFAAIWKGRISKSQIDKILETCISFDLVDKEIEDGVPFQVGIIFANPEEVYEIEEEDIKIYTAKEFGEIAAK